MHVRHISEFSLFPFYVCPFFFLFTPFLSVLPPPSCFFSLLVLFSLKRLGGEGGALQYMWGLWIVIKGLLRFFFRLLYSISSASAPFAMWGGYCTVWRRFTLANISCIRKFSLSVWFCSACDVSCVFHFLRVRLNRQFPVFYRLRSAYTGGKISAVVGRSQTAAESESVRAYVCVCSRRGREQGVCKYNSGGNMDGRVSESDRLQWLSDHFRVPLFATKY